jgi:hypothetical protein
MAMATGPDINPNSAGDASYFDLSGLIVVDFPASWCAGLGVMLVVAMGFAAGGSLLTRRRFSISLPCGW